MFLRYILLLGGQRDLSHTFHKFSELPTVTVLELI